MAHAFGNYAQRHAFGLCRRCPAVARHIHGEAHVEAEYAGYFLEVVVDVVGRVAVDAPLVGAWRSDDGQQVAAFVFGIFVEDFLHFAGPADGEALACLAAAVHHRAALAVGLAQKGHVDETHAAQIEAHHEHVAGEIESRAQRQVELLYSLHGR